MPHVIEYSLIILKYFVRGRHKYFRGCMSNSWKVRQSVYVWTVTQSSNQLNTDWFSVPGRKILDYLSKTAVFQCSVVWCNTPEFKPWQNGFTALRYFPTISKLNTTRIWSATPTHGFQPIFYKSHIKPLWCHCCHIKTFSPNLAPSSLDLML